MWRSLAQRALKNKKRIVRRTALAGTILLFGGLLLYSHLFGPADNYGMVTPFIVPADSTLGQAAELAKTQGMVKSSWALQFALLEKTDRKTLRPGEYELNPNMDAWTIAEILTKPPALAFITFPPSLRKEQMGDILADNLGWSDAQQQEWNTTATSPDPDFIEGVYYADTYLIPSDQSPAQIAARLRGRFTDVFAPYAAQAHAQGIPWTKVLTLASIVDREAGKTDKPLVAGILWNRIDKGMKLQADATLQYIQGRQGNWWPQAKASDKFIDSPFNTYQHVGLPPHPIDTPSMESIAAVLSPDKTSCIYYLHDYSHQIHCSLTYADHAKKVDTYLR